MTQIIRPTETLDDQVRRVTASIKGRNGSGYTDDAIERTVRESFAEQEGARITEYVSVLAERSARERLRRL